MASLPDFVKLAEAYGHVGIAIKRLAQAVKNRLVFMDVMVDGGEDLIMRRILSVLLEGGAVVMWNGRLCW